MQHTPVYKYMCICKRVKFWQPCLPWRCICSTVPHTSTHHWVVGQCVLVQSLILKISYMHNIGERKPTRNVKNKIRFGLILPANKTQRLCRRRRDWPEYELGDEWKTQLKQFLCRHAISLSPGQFVTGTRASFTTRRRTVDSQGGARSRVRIRWGVKLTKKTD